MHQDDVSDKAGGTEAEIEVDVGGCGMQLAEGLIASSQRTEA